MICPAEHDLSRALSDGADDAVTAHLAECARCRDTWQGFERAIRLARELAADVPSSTHREEVRTALLASVDAVPRRVPRVSRLVWVAGGIAAAATAALWLARATPDEEPPSHATLHPSPGASFAVSSGPPDEIVRLHDGVLAIDVDLLGPEDRFRVVVGDDEVEVRGTSFEVTAQADKLVGVRVAHGRVEVRPRVGAPTSVGAGQAWHGERTASLEFPSGTQTASSGTQTASSGTQTASSGTQTASSGVQTTARDGTPGRDVAITRDATTTRKAAPASAGSPSKLSSGTPALEPRPPAIGTERRDIAKPVSPEETAYNDAWDALRASEFRKAALGFARVVALSPAGPLADDAAYWRAVSLARAARGTEAIEAFRELLDGYPSSPRSGQASVMLGWLLVDANQHAEAERRFRSAANDASESVRASARSGLDALAAKRSK